MEKILVIGGAGFIGSHVVECLMEHNCQVLVYDNLSTGKKGNLPEGARLVVADIMDVENLERKISEVDYVIHLAALTSVEESLHHPERYFEVNLLGTLNILKSSVRYKIKKVIYSSSSSVYGSVEDGPSHEGMHPNPSNPYGLTKLNGEDLLKLYNQMYGLSFVALRYYNVFGERQNFNSDYASVIPIFINRALRNQDLMIYGDGYQTRDFIYVKDVARANWLALKGGFGIYNVSTMKEHSILDLAHKILAFTGAENSITFEKPLLGDDRRALGNNKLIKRELGWGPQDVFDSNLRKVIDYYRKGLER